MRPNVGMVFIDDLRAFSPWMSDRARAWAQRRGLDGALMSPTVSPPPVLVVVARSLAWTQLELSSAWMRGAAAVIVVVDSSDDSAPGAPAEALPSEERQQLQAMLGDDVEVVALGSTGLDAAIDHALALALRRAESCARPWPSFAIVDGADDPPNDPGSWFAWRPPGWRDTGDTAAVELADVVQALAPALCRFEGRAMWLDGVAGDRIDLRTGARASVPGLAGAAEWGRPLAAFPDGGAWLRGWPRHRAQGPTWPTWEQVHADPSEPALLCAGGHGQAIGVDPTAQVAFTGGRCTFDWRVLGPRGPVLWTPSSHDWPCGHGKKLYGYEDNDPLSVQLSGDAAACLSTYQHDTLLTPGLPLRWRDLGGFALAERHRGEPRALLFERADGDEGFPGDPYQADEDARDRFVVASLGPSSQARYVVGIGAPTYRLVDGVVTRLGAGNEWLVCDEQHQVVRREAGRMLAGWGRWVVFEEKGRLWREDLSKDRRFSLGAVDRAVAGAVAVPGTPNAVLISLEPEVALKLV